MYTFINNNKKYLRSLCTFALINNNSINIECIIRIHVYYEFEIFVCIDYVHKLSSLNSSVVFVILVVRRRSVPATKWRATKCPRDEMAGDELYPRRNGWRRIVPATKWQAAKRRRRNGGD